MWNFKGQLWNFTQNFEPMHRKICILPSSIFACELRYLWILSWKALVKRALYNKEYPSKTHLKHTSHEISFAHNLFLNYPVVWTTDTDVMGKRDFTRDLGLRSASGGYPIFFCTRPQVIGRNASPAPPGLWKCHDIFCSDSQARHPVCSSLTQASTLIYFLLLNWKKCHSIAPSQKLPVSSVQWYWDIVFGP